MIRMPPCLLCVASLLFVTGCGAQQVLLGTEGQYVFTVTDRLALPGESVEVTARLQVGDLLATERGYVVLFDYRGRPYKAAQTDAAGKATVTFTPPETGDYVLRTRVAPVGLAQEPPQARDARIVCRPADEPMVVVDLDKTLVASGFDQVLVGDPQPMDGSVEVIRRLAEEHTIIYLTHRPDLFGPKSKSWLTEQGYPPGPVLLASIGGFLAGSGEYKTRELERLQDRFTNIRAGFGDKVSDAAAYHARGLRSFLIVPIPDAAEDVRDLAVQIHALDESIEVVTDWDQVAGALWRGERYPKSAMVRRLRDIAWERTVATHPATAPISPPATRSGAPPGDAQPGAQPPRGPMTRPADDPARHTREAGS